MSPYRIIFVCGGTHSGTTLMAAILGAHDEAYLIPYETSTYMQNTDTPSQLLYNIDTDLKIVIEKTPRNVFFIEDISRDFPDSFFVVIFRNPIDVCASLFKRLGDWKVSLTTTDEDLQGCIDASSLPNVTLVAYEDIVDNCEKEIERICLDVGIEYEENMKNFYSHNPTWIGSQIKEEGLNVRALQVRQPLYDGRGKGMKELTEEQIQEVTRMCMDKYNRLLLINKNRRGMDE